MSVYKKFQSRRTDNMLSSREVYENKNLRKWIKEKYNYSDPIEELREWNLKSIVDHNKGLTEKNKIKQLKERLKMEVNRAKMEFRLIDEKIKIKGGKSKLLPIEEYIFGLEDETIRLVMILKMEEKMELVIRRSHIPDIEDKTLYGASNNLNKLFVFGNLPLKAFGKKDEINIRKTEGFNIENYKKGDCKPLNPKREPLIKIKLDEVKAAMEDNFIKI